MKTILTAAALAATIASPALAQEWMARPAPGAAFAQSWELRPLRPADAYARGFVRDTRPHLGNPAWHVYNGAGEYVGTDPDGFIRNDLARDPPGKNDD